MAPPDDDGNNVLRTRARLAACLRVGALLDGAPLEGHAVLSALLPELGAWAALIRPGAADPVIVMPRAAPVSVVTRVQEIAAAPMMGPMQVMMTGGAAGHFDAVMDQHVAVAAAGNSQRVLGVLMCGRAEPYAHDDVETLQDVARRIHLALSLDELSARATQASRARDDFLAQLSHELRTPLTAMLGWARVLRSAGIDDEKRARGLESLERSAMAQAQLVENLLEVSRLISGRLKLVHSDVDLAALAQTVIASAKQFAGSRGVTVMAGSLDATARVHGDHDRLQNVLWNLVQNAVKFTPRGGMVTVEVLRDDGTVRIRVIDTGKGIAADDLRSVFDRFKLQDFSSGKQASGLGLGLSVVRQLVELHGGKVSAHSDGENRGATFTVELPAQ